MNRLLVAAVTLSPTLVAGAAVALTVIHPLIHGTPLDSGALDGLLASLTACACAGPRSTR